MIEMFCMLLVSYLFVSCPWATKNAPLVPQSQGSSDSQPGNSAPALGIYQLMQRVKHAEQSRTAGRTLAQYEAAKFLRLATLLKAGDPLEPVRHGSWFPFCTRQVIVFRASVWHVECSV